MRNQKWLSIAKSEAGEQSLKSVLKAATNVANKTNNASVSYTLNGLWMGKEKIGRIEYDVLELPGGGATEIEGQPELPTEGLFVALPKGATNVSVKVASATREIQKQKYLIKPVPKQITEIELIEGKVVTNIIESSYNNAKLYPGKEVEFIGLKEVDDVTVAHLMVYPVQYKASEKQITLIKQMQLEISYTLPKVLPKVSERQFVPINGNFVLGYSAMKTINSIQAPETLMQGLQIEPLKITRGTSKKTTFTTAISANLITELAPVSGAVISAMLSLKFNSRNSELIIITSSSLRDAMEPYRAARAFAPFNAIIVTTEKIQTDFPATSLKKSIKDFITHAYNNYTTRPRYFVLGGDVDIIPMDIVTRGGNQYATDHYYADMAGNLTPELIVSRVPTSDFTVMQNTCKFFADYYHHRGADWNGDWLSKVLLVAYQNSQPTYTECSDQIATNISSRFGVTKLYGQNTSKANVISAINGGASIVHYRGHGGETNWSSANGINTTDIGALNFGSKIPLVFNICCQNGRVDNASGVSVAEAWIRNRKAIATLASSRDSWTYPNNDFAKYLFEAVMEGHNSAGKIILRAKTKMVLNHSTSNGHMDNLVMYNLFGDPTANVVSSADFLRGIWDMEHDGWKGSLNIKSLYSFILQKIGSEYYPIWFFNGEYTTQGGEIVTVSGRIGGKDVNNTNANQKSNHRIEFWIKFSETNNQKFSGYVYTRNKKSMAGYTWWSGTPFGFHAVKR